LHDNKGRLILSGGLLRCGGGGTRFIAA